MSCCIRWLQRKRRSNRLGIQRLFSASENVLADERIKSVKVIVRFFGAPWRRFTSDNVSAPLAWRINYPAILQIWRSARVRDPDVELSPAERERLPAVDCRWLGRQGPRFVRESQALRARSVHGRNASSGQLTLRRPEFDGHLWFKFS